MKVGVETWKGTAVARDVMTWFLHTAKIFLSWKTKPKSSHYAAVL